MDISVKDRIKKYLESFSREEEDAIADLFLDSGNQAEIEKVSMENWESSSSESVDLQHVLNHLHFQINTSAKKESSVHRILRSYSRIAAILLVPLLIGSLFLVYERNDQKPSINQIISQAGSRVKFILPDGSTGYLNGRTTLSYNADFKNNRTLTMDGEGYFEVAKDKQHPFVVKTKYADIKVLGTKFDLCAYSNDNNISTTLEEGSVHVINHISKKDIVLKPGNQLQISTANGEMKIEDVNTMLYTSWIDDVLRFDNSTFDDVVKKMERWYGINIVLDESLKYTERYTLTIKTESLRELLQLLALTTPMDYEINNDTLYIHQPMKK